MTEALRSYRLLESRLWYTRWRHEGAESPEEDTILDEMDRIWLQLSEEEQTLVRTEGPRCWPMHSYWPPPLVLGSLQAPRPWTYEEFRSPEETILDADAA